jgi:hypothetical protein
MWKAIPGFEDYEASTDGEIRSWREHMDGRKYQNTLPRILKPSNGPNGYLVVSVRRTGKPKGVKRLVHRLIAITFLPNPLNFSDVAHMDGNNRNNRKDNLRWSTHRDNQMDMRTHGTMQDGEKCCTSKLTADQVAEIRRRILIEGRGSQRRIAAEYGLSIAQVSRIKTRKRWACLD